MTTIAEQYFLKSHQFLVVAAKKAKPVRGIKPTWIYEFMDGSRLVLDTVRRFAYDGSGNELRSN